MKITHLQFIAAALALSIVSTACISLAQESAEPPMTPEMEAEMAVWMELAQPTAHHAHLKALEGRWAGEVTMWMGPAAAPMVNSSTAEATFILGGRYLEWKHIGDFGGMPFEGRAIEGFNNGDRRYESIWIDNFGTLMMFFTGSCSDDGASREMKSSFSDPVAGGTITYRTVTVVNDADHFTYTAYMDKGTGEFKNMEIRYTRRR